MLRPAVCCPRCGLNLLVQGTERRGDACPRGHGRHISAARAEREIPWPVRAALRVQRARAKEPAFPCVECRGTMLVLRKADGPRGAEIDGCPSCGGLWFDGDELLRVQKEGLLPVGAPRWAKWRLLQAPWLMLASARVR